LAKDRKTEDEAPKVQNFQKVQKTFVFPVDDSLHQANFAIPPNAGLHESRDGGSWFSHILGLQIGTQFCPGMMKRKRGHQSRRRS
jgi:hypothetical protein